MKNLSVPRARLPVIHKPEGPKMHLRGAGLRSERRSVTSTLLAAERKLGGIKAGGQPGCSVKPRRQHRLIRPRRQQARSRQRRCRPRPVRIRPEPRPQDDVGGLLLPHALHHGCNRSAHLLLVQPQRRQVLSCLSVARLQAKHLLEVALSVILTLKCVSCRRVSKQRFDAVLLGQVLEVVEKTQGGRVLIVMASAEDLGSLKCLLVAGSRV